jgi:hypothetical protein
VKTEMAMAGNCGGITADMSYRKSKYKEKTSGRII